MVEVLGVQLGTVAQVMTMLFGGGIFGVLIKGYVDNRKVTVNADYQLRTHFGDELKRLAQKAVESDKRHEDCEQGKASLRRELDEMHKERLEDRNEIEGLKRQISQYSANKLIELSERCPPSDQVVAAARSTLRHTNGDK